MWICLPDISSHKLLIKTTPVRPHNTAKVSTIKCNLHTIKIKALPERWIIRKTTGWNYQKSAQVAPLMASPNCNHLISIATVCIAEASHRLEKCRRTLKIWTLRNEMMCLLKVWAQAVRWRMVLLELVQGGVATKSDRREVLDLRIAWVSRVISRWVVARKMEMLTT